MTILFRCTHVYTRTHTTTHKCTMSMSRQCVIKPVDHQFIFIRHHYQIVTYDLMLLCITFVFSLIRLTALNQARFVRNKYAGQKGTSHLEYFNTKFEIKKFQMKSMKKKLTWTSMQAITFSQNAIYNGKKGKSNQHCAVTLSTNRQITFSINDEQNCPLFLIVLLDFS